MLLKQHNVFVNGINGNAVAVVDGDDNDVIDGNDDDVNTSSSSNGFK